MIGQTIGHYRITSKIGSGGMGEVFLAEDTRLGRKAAIKFLPAELADDPERRQRLLKEAKAASALNHPHVCVVYDVGEGRTSLHRDGIRRRRSARRRAPSGTDRDRKDCRCCSADR